MDYVIAIFLLGLIVTFVVIVGLARAAEFAKAESAQHLEIDPVPDDLELVPEPESAQPRERATSASTFAT